MVYAIAKINKNEMNFSVLFGADEAPPITFVTDKLFETESAAQNFIQTDLQKKSDNKATTDFDRGTDEDKKNWEKLMRDDEKVCMHSYTYLIVPVASMVEILGRPEFLKT